MSTLSLCGDYYSAVTVVSNIFIDNFMLDANDAQIKIYLYLLRCIGANMPVSVSSMADFFNYTEKDILRALKYWDKKQLLELSFGADKQLAGIRLCTPISTMCTPISTNGNTNNVSDADSADSLHVHETSKRSSESAACLYSSSESKISKVVELKSKPSYSSARLLEFKKNPDVANLLFAAEQYLGKPLSSADISSILYMNEVLAFSPDLIEYLIEFCVNNKKKSMHYIEKVANSWADAQISSIEEAKAFTSNISAEAYAVFKAFGMNNHTPIGPELEFVRKWCNSYDFSIEMIEAACSKTIMSIHEPSFEYTDKILLSWKNNNLKTIAEVKEYDSSRKTAASPTVSCNKALRSPSRSQGTRTNNSSSRKYDFALLEEELLSN